jgi:hypothetical protein
MQLWSGPSTRFIRDTVHNQIAGMLFDAFFRHYRYRPSPGEVNSWRNSLRAVSLVFQDSHLDDHGVILEYQLPLTSRRLDCLVCGSDGAGVDSAVIIELKQWDRCGEAAGENLVSAWVGGSEREILHPSAQVRQYQHYLEESHTAFWEGPKPVRLASCAYLHNYEPAPEDVIFAPRFAGLLESHPAFTADEVDPLKEYLLGRLSGGHGMPVLDRIQQSKYRPSKKLMDHVAEMIEGQQTYVLLDEQLVVFEQVLARARAGFGSRRKSVIVVKGGPGTGKSVIALNLMSRLLHEGLNAHYATGSKAFTETLRKIIGPRGEVQFKYFNSYTQAGVNEIDVLVCDEAHRLRRVSADRFTPRAQRKDTPQVEEIVNAAKLAVFLIDDKQVVRPREIGSSAYIREHAERLGCDISEYELEAQFRCAGSDGFVNWVNNTLGIERTANVMWEGNEAFDFRIIDSPEALEVAIRARSAEGFSARMTAGFCWPWSKPNPDGTLVDDVQIGDYRRPWNAKHDARKLARGIPRAQLWAYDPNGIDQIGCVYTAQGFEFDYVGVIFGPDLRYNFDTQAWEGHREDSSDGEVRRGGERFVDLVKNTYRVLLSRGLKGCYVHFMDKDTERFVKSRMETAAVTVVPETAVAVDVMVSAAVEPFRRLPAAEARPFENCVPLHELEVAAGKYSEEQQAGGVRLGEEDRQPRAVKWVELPEGFRPRRGMFVARVVGESMNRRIPNGAWCLFRVAGAGTRQGKVVLAQHREIQDSETGGHFTVKVYESRKERLPDGSWRHTSIVLRPDTSAAGYEPIVLTPEAAADLRIIAELVAVLG